MYQKNTKVSYHINILKLFKKFLEKLSFFKRKYQVINYIV